MFKALFCLLLRIVYRLRVTGLQNLEGKEGAYLFIPQFTSSIDPVLAALFLPGRPRLALPRHYTLKWPRFLLRWVRPLLLDPSDSSALKEFIRYVREGNNGVFFPEERQAVDGQLSKIQEISLLIAEQSGAFLVPVRFKGSEHSPFSLTAGKEHAPRLFPRITVLMGTPCRLEPDAGYEASGREGKRHWLWCVMRDFKFDSDWKRCTLMDACLVTRREWGGGHLALMDPDFIEVSWNQLLARLILFCDLLKDSIVPGGRVGILLPNSVHGLTALLAVQRLEAVPALLNYSAGMHAILASCRLAGIQTVITSRRFLDVAKMTRAPETFEAEGIRLLQLEDITKGITAAERLGAWLRGLMLRPRFEPGAEERTALILFTSGSEGTPKGVALSHSNIQANCAQIISGINFSSQDRIMSSMPMFHSLGLCSAILAPLIIGMPVVMYPTPLHFKTIPAVVYAARCSIVLGTNAFLNGYAKSANPDDFSSVKIVVCGGDRLEEATYNLWMQKFGIRVTEGYGVTENSPVVSYNTREYFRFGTVGQLVPGVRARLEPVEGVSGGGRLLVCGPNVMQGYLISGKDALLEPEKGWYDTGDIVSIDEEGFVTIMGRVKRFAKIGGEMLSLAAVEDMLRTCWPNYRHAVVSVPDEHKGESLLLVTEMPDLKRDVIRSEFIKRGLPEIAIPRKTLYMREIPRMGTGKADYAKIQQIIQEKTDRDIPPSGTSPA